MVFVIVLRARALVARRFGRFFIIILTVIIIRKTFHLVIDLSNEDNLNEAKHHLFLRNGYI